MMIVLGFASTAVVLAFIWCTFYPRILQLQFNSIAKRDL
jgi:hypothetical protein